MDIEFIVKSILKKIWVIILIPAITVICAFFLTKNIDKYYKSTAQIATGIIERDKINISEENYSIMEGDIKFSNLIENLNSRLVLNLVSYNLLLRKLNDPSAVNELINSDIDPMAIEDIRNMLSSKIDSIQLLSTYKPEERQVESILESFEYDYISLQKSFSIYRLRRSDFIQISFFSKSPELSAFAVNTLINEYIRYDNFLSSKNENQSLEFLSSLVSKKKEELDQKSAKLQLFKSNNQLYNFDTEGESKMNRLNTYETEKSNSLSKLNALKINLDNVNKRIAQINATPSTIVQNQRIVEIREKIKTLNNEYFTGNRQNESLLDSLSKLRELERVELNKLKMSSLQSGSNQIQDLINQREQLETEIQVINENLIDLDEKIGLIKYQVADFASKEAIVNGLEREINVATEEYLGALNKYNDAKNIMFTSENRIKPVFWAEPASDPEPSKRMIILGLSGAISFFLTFVTILAFELLNFKIRTPKMFEKEARQKPLGILCAIKNDREKQNKLFIVNDSAKKENAKFKHQIRKIRYDLIASPRKSFLITSTRENSGKSFFILNLCHALSLIQKKVLIIDTNFRNNALSKFLIPNFKNQHSLEYLSRNVSGSNSVSLSASDVNIEKSIVNNLTIKTKNPYVNIIGNKGGDFSPNEILPNESLKTLLESVNPLYDFIFLEGSSLNEYSDSKELINYVEGVVSIFKADTQIDSVDKESLDFLSHQKDKYLGTILSKIAIDNLTY